MEKSSREIVMKWWNSLSFEEKFYKTIAANSVLIGDTVDNHPDRLTGSEIEKVFEYHEEDKCESCENEGSLEPHTCPYSEEIGGDFETLCNCCENCQSNCAGDI